MSGQTNATNCYLKFWTNVVCWLIVGEVSIVAFTCMEAMTLFVNAGKSRGGCSKKKLTGCAARVFATIPQLGYGDQGPKSYLWLRKMGQNQTLNNRKCHQINHFWINHFWSILHGIGQICHKSCQLLEKKKVELGQNLPKIYPWLRSLSQN